MVDAKKHEEASKAAEARSEAAMHNHHRWAQALTLIQVAMALAAITILTRQKAMELGAVGAAAGSIVLGTMAASHL